MFSVTEGVAILDIKEAMVMTKVMGTKQDNHSTHSFWL